MRVKEFLKNWNGDFNIVNEKGAIYTSFKENVTEKMANQDIVDIKLIQDHICTVDIVIKESELEFENRILSNPELYLVKGKRSDSGEWVKGYLWHGSDECLIIPHNTGVGYDEKTNQLSTGAFEVDKATICRSTGFKDIWEYDIVEIILDGKKCSYVVMWDEEELDFKATNGKENYGTSFCYLFNADEIKVIGNAFDNKELLKSIE